MVASNKRFKKRLLAVFEKTNTASVFHSLATTGKSPEFVFQASEYLPVLVHTVGFYSPEESN